MKCRNCNTGNPESAKFCMNCGAPLSTGEKSAEPKSQFLGQYLPPELLAKLQAARAREAMVGERRVITMLFCDVKGSTAAAEKVDPEVWTEIMNGAFERMIGPIYKYEGLVPRLMGDAILAFFGAPIAHEDDPQRAILAGLDIQAGMQAYVQDMHRKYGLEFGLRVGINTGLVVVGEIGSDLRMEYTAIGDAINLAARMEQTAAPGTVQITEDTYKLVAPLFDFEPLGSIEVKGKSAPVNAYCVLGRKQEPGHLRGLAGLTSPLVGREEQLSLLHKQLSQLHLGTGGLVAIIGEAGLGKSSLIAEVQRTDTAARTEWLRGEALSYSRSISYFPWRQIIRQSIGATDSDSPADVRGKLGHVCNRYTLPGGDIPFLQTVLAVESEESLQVLAGYQGEALVERMTEAACGYLRGLAAENPLVLIFDDLHWADEASLNLLLNVAELSRDQPMLFLCMLRPDKLAASWETMPKLQQKLGERFHSIELEPLRVAQTDTLLMNLLGMQDLPRKLRDLIVEKAGGNPFFVEELIRSLIETKQIVRDNSHWRVASADAAQRVSLPDTLRGVLGARIDRLPEPTRHILQMAAVIGRSFDLRVLESLARVDGLAAHIGDLKEAGLIEPLQEQYAFRHVLIQDAAYDSILMKQRPELHRQVGESLETLHADRLEEFAPLLAHHFYAAQDDRSLKYDLLAGEKAARLYANAEATTHFSRALETAKRISAGKEQVAQLYSKLGGVLELTGRYEQALANYDAMQAFGHDHQEPSIEVAALMAKGTLYSTPTALRNPEMGEETMIKALELSNQIGDLSVQTKLNWNLMLNTLHSNRLDQAFEYGQRALKFAREGIDREQLAFVLNDMARVLICRGDFQTAITEIKEARGLWRQMNNQVMLADNLGAEEEAHFSMGDYEQVIGLAKQALEICESMDNLWGKSYHRLLMGLAHFERGESRLAIKLVEEAVELGDNGGLIISSIAGRCDLAWFYGWCGAIDKGLELIEPAIESARANLPDWAVMPVAMKVRLYALREDIRSAEEAASIIALEPPSLPYPHYTLMVRQAQVELAWLRADYAGVLASADMDLKELSGILRAETPQIIARKGDALLALGRAEEAQQILTQVRKVAEGRYAKHELWPILASLAAVESKLGEDAEATALRAEARQIMNGIAEDLRPLGLQDAFLNQLRAKALNR